MNNPEPTVSASTEDASLDPSVWLRQLPRYSRSLLKIKVPVTVTLATSRQPVRKIRDLVPGSILQFEKLCDETLSLEVGDRPVAEGEAVRVGDKFGIRVTAMVMPEEKFYPIAGKTEDKNRDQVGYDPVE